MCDNFTRPLFSLALLVCEKNQVLVDSIMLAKRKPLSYKETAQKLFANLLSPNMNACDDMFDDYYHQGQTLATMMYLVEDAALKKVGNEFYFSVPKFIKYHLKFCLLAFRSRKILPEKKQIVIDYFKSADIDVRDTFAMFDYFRKIEMPHLCPLFPIAKVPTVQTTHAVIDEYFVLQSDMVLAKKMIELLQRMNPENPYLLSSVIADPFRGRHELVDRCENLDDYKEAMKFVKE